MANLIGLNDYRVVQLNFTPEIESILYAVCEISLFLVWLLWNCEYFHFWCEIQSDLHVYSTYQNELVLFTDRSNFSSLVCLGRWRRAEITLTWKRRSRSRRWSEFCKFFNWFALTNVQKNAIHVTRQGTKRKHVIFLIHNQSQIFHFTLPISTMFIMILQGRQGPKSAEQQQAKMQSEIKYLALFITVIKWRVCLFTPYPR